MRAIPEPRFRLGQPVQVSSACENAGEWADIKLVITGIEFDRRTGEIAYTCHEEYELASRNRGGGSDGWSEDDLSPRMMNPEAEPAP